MIQLRQGDVLLVAVDALPPAALPAAPVARAGRRRHVAAAGEATGHAHTLPADGRVGLLHVAGGPDPAAGGYLVVRGPGVALAHGEHRPLPVPAGLYRVVRQRAYDPASRRWAPHRD